MKNIYIYLVLSFAIFSSINAQKTISYYQFTETAGTFTSISTTGTNIGTGDDSEFPLDLSGSFSFIYNENNYSQFE